MEARQFVFGAMPILANRIQVLADQGMKVMSLKQFLLFVTILQFGDEPPMLSEVAQEMGSSRQNIKQLALKLCEKGFLKMIKDPHDSRVLRLQVIVEADDIFKDEIDYQNRFLEELYKDISAEEVRQVANVLFRMVGNIEVMEKRIKEEE